MVNYNPDEMRLWGEFSKHRNWDKSIRWPDSMHFSIEDSFTKEEKIEAIDTYNQREGILTYAIGLVDKWNKDKKSLSVDKDGWVRTNSLKAWLKQNDPKKLVDDYYRYGTFEIYHEAFGLDSNTKREAENILLSDRIINNLFHKFCVNQCKAEEAIYLKKDPKAVKFRKVREYARNYNIFGTQMLCDFSHNLDSAEIESIDEKLLDTLIEKFKAFEEMQEKFNKDFVQISKDFGWRQEL